MTKNKQYYRGVISYVMKGNIIKAVSDQNAMGDKTNNFSGMVRVGTTCVIRFRSE